RSVARALRERGFDRQRVRKGTLGGHRVEGIANADDARDERDLGPGQTVGIARSVTPPATGAHESRDAGEIRRGGEDALADLRVVADELPLVDGEWSGLVQ